MTLLLGALIAAAPCAMDVCLASMPSMTRALHASTAEMQLTSSVDMYGKSSPTLLRWHQPTMPLARKSAIVATS